MENDLIYSPEQLRVAPTEPQQVEKVSKREYELIQELIKLRQEKNIELQFEDLDDYEVPPRTQFSMLQKPAVTFKKGTLTFNAAAIRMFEGIKHIIPMMSKKRKRLVVIMCSEEESSSVEWARKKKDKWVSKTITSREYVKKICTIMGWDESCRYKALGNITNSSEGLVLRFDLDEAVMFAPQKTEIYDPVSGQMKKTQLTYYPDIYKERLGKSYSDYVTTRQLSMFENLEDYESQAETTNATDVIHEQTSIVTEGGEMNE